METVVIRFNLKVADEDLQLDFKGDTTVKIRYFVQRKSLRNCHQ